MDAPQHPAAEVEVRLQPAARQLNANEVQAKILRNKIVAFNKLVTTSVQLPSNTTEHLVNKLPKTMQELLQVPGIMPFANACSRANRDLLGFLARSAPAKG
jgi:precorrin-2 methylase